MTVRVLGLESGVTSLEDHRHLVSLFLPPTGAGILQRQRGLVPSSGAADLSTASAMQADIAAFVAWIDGTSASIQGGYPFVSDAAVTLTFSDGDATNDRIDRVVAQIRDDPYDGSGETDGRVVVVEGTAASSPSPPAVPASSLPLYQVLVEAGTSAGSGGIDFGADVTDEREYRDSTSPVITRRTRSQGAVSISFSSPTSLSTVTLPIPATWSSYDVELFAMVEFIDMSGNDDVNSTVVNLDATFDGATMAQDAAAEFWDINSHDAEMFPLVTFLEGQTVTGNRVVDMRAIRQGTPEIDATRRSMIARAWRTA